MKKHAVIFWLIILYFWLFVFGQMSKAHAVEKTFAWGYNKYYHASVVNGYRLYMGITPDAVNQLVADIPKASAIVSRETPILMEEHFNTDPGTKYTTTGGPWVWNSEKKNMKITTGEGKEFMFVLEYPAGVANNFSFQFWPEKKYGTDGLIYTYLKDDGSLTGSNYYELRLASGDTRYSNYRKVVNSQFGGVQGAFALPRFAECALKAEGETICPGFPVSQSWSDSFYMANWNGVEVGGKDPTPLNIVRLEIIVTNQDGWIDDIIIGGQIELQKKVDVQLPDALKIYFAISAYGPAGEGAKSSVYEYLPGSVIQSTDRPPMPGSLYIVE